MTGTSTSATIAGTARAASSVFTVTRTSSLPAWCSARTCATVAATSAVSVLVMDWTTIGWALPTGTPPTSAVTVGRRVLTRAKYITGVPVRRRRRVDRASLEDLVLEDDAEAQHGQPHASQEVGADVGGDPRSHADPQGVRVEHAVGERDGRRREELNHRRLRSRDGPVRRDVGRGRVDVRRAFGEVDPELDRPGPRGVLDDGGTGHLDAVHTGLPQARGQEHLLRRNGGVGGRRDDAGDIVVDRVPAGRRNEAQHVHIEDGAPFPTGRRAQRGREDEGGSCRFHNGFPSRARWTWPS